MSEDMSLQETVGRLASRIRSMGPGDRAELRRLDPAAPSGRAFWSLLPGDRELSPEEETRWGVVIQGMTEVAHSPSSSVGDALFSAGVSDTRFQRFIDCDPVKDIDSIRRVCGFLHSKGVAVNWVELATFILTRKTEKSEIVRRRICRRYYARSAK